MNIQDINNGIKAGTIKIDLKGHRVHDVGERIDQEVNHLKEMVREYTTGKGKSQKDSKADKTRMLEHYKRSLTDAYEIGDYLGYTGMERQCFDCGATMYIVIKDETTLSLIPTPAYWKLRDEGAVRENISKYDYQIKPEEIPSCEAKSLKRKKKLVSEIEVPSGELIFQNFFKTEKLYVNPKNRYGHPDINSVLGRNVLMQYLAKQNVGYAQMGNMSVSIHLKDDGTEIIVTNPYGYDGEKDEEYEIEFEGFKQIGMISLDVWRWQCADKKVLEEAEEPIKEISTKTDTYADAVLAKVKKGKWRIEHYFDFFTRKDDEKRNPIYSKLSLVE